MQDKSISIIVPIYKVEQYLDKCVKSIVEQTYSNIQIILVDDGSPDNCPKMCDDWAEKDSRIIVIHQANSGVSSARNAGIKISNGEYVLFVDGDDFLASTCCFNLMQQVKNNSYDILFFKHLFYNCTNNEYNKKNDDFSICYYHDKEDLIKKAILSKDHFDYNIGTPWAKLIKTSLIKENNLSFNEALTHSEDRVFMFECLVLAKKIGFYNFSGYIYNFNITSICQSYTKNLWGKLINTYEAMQKNLIKYNFEEYIDLLKCAKINFFYTALKQDVFHQQNKESFIKKCYIANKIIKSDLNFKHALIHSKEFSKKRQLFNILFRYKLNVLIYLLFAFK